MPQGPAGFQGQSPAHLRRTSQQSQHADMNMGGRGGGYMGGRGNGRQYSNQGQPMPYSPGPAGFRPGPGSGRPPSIPPQFQHQYQYPGSPHGGPPRSPGLPGGSNPGTPQQMHAMPNMYAQQHYMYQSNMQQPPFPQQAQYDPNYQYYQQPYGMHPTFQPGGPPSPRQFNQAPPTHRQSMINGQYSAVPPAMSRTSSQISERPASSLSAHPPQSGTPSHPSHTPSQSASAIAPPPAQNNFTIPKKSKGIIIKNADGEVVTFDKKSSPAPAAITKAPSPAPSSSAAPTPPPPEVSHKRTESKSGKSAEEIKAEFQARVKAQQLEQSGVKEEVENTKASIRPEDAVATSTASELEQTKAATEKAAANAREEKVEAQNETEAEPEQIQKPSVTETEAKQETATAVATSEKKEETPEEKKAREDAETEAMIAEMEAADKAEAEREAAFQAKKQKEAAEKKSRAAEDAKKADEEMKRQERLAEEREKERESKPQEETAAEEAENQKLFASLKKTNLGPQGEQQDDDEEAAASRPASGSMPPPSKPASANKPKPAALKLETNKSVEPAQPTPGMRSLRSARMLQLQSDNVTYPEGIQSPNPALNQLGKRNGRVYDTSFLMQFKGAFTEKPQMDWDDKLKSIVGDNDGPKSARTPGGLGRNSSGRPAPGSFNGPMGSFTSGSRTLPSGTTSSERFAASQRGGTMQNPLAQFGGIRPGGAFPMGNVGSMGPGRNLSMSGSSRGAGGRTVSHKGSQRTNHKEHTQQNKTMPLTAGMELKPLEASNSGWKPMSLGPAKPGADSAAHMAPDMVQRKVKAALNKMTPERFDKIADQIMTIAAQSKDETDGRSLRQVIALTFEKACDEAHWASMYAKFCKRMLEEMSPEIKDENVRDKGGVPVVGGPLFRKYLLNRCQEEFERGWTMNLPDKPEGQTEEAAMLSDEYYIAAAAKRKGLGLIQFIGELYKLGMLSIRIMHECVSKLLDFEGEPDEAAVESLVKLLRTVGATMEASDQGPSLVKTYFDRIDKIMAGDLPSRINFMLLDTVDLRRAGWRSKDDAKGPKTIQEIREEAANAQAQAELERQKSNVRGGGGGRMQQGRGDARNFSGPPPDYRSNTVGTDELRKLGQKSASRQASGPARGLGPTSMFPSRSNSGRPGLGPRIGDSGNNSRSGSQRGEKKEEDKTSANAFR